MLRKTEFPKISGYFRFAFFALIAFTSIASAANRVTYDNQCLTIDGKDTYIFSGAFHYFRCPKELWHDRFAKMKLAGCNAVETYVPWNYHEKKCRCHWMIIPTST